MAAKAKRRRIKVDERRGYVGGSSWASVLGLSKYRTSFETYQEYKHGIKKEVSIATQEIFDMGHKLEKFVADMTMEKYGVSLVASPYLYEYEFDKRLGCHPDRLCKSDPSLAVEIKTSSVYDNERWGEADSDAVPYDYLLQCYSYFACIPGIETVWLMRFSNNRLTRYIIHKDEEMLERIIEDITAILDTWDDGYEPVPQSYTEAMERLVLHSGEAMATGSMIEAYKEYCQLAEKIKECEKRQDELKTEMTGFLSMEECDSVVDKDGNKLFSVIEQRRSSFDKKALLAEHPEFCAYESYTISRQLRINQRKSK